MMILIDTNILARLLLNDIPDHYARVVALFETAPHDELELFAPSSVFIELSYLLTNTKGVPKGEAAAMMLEVITLPGLVVEHAAAVESALRFWSRQGPLSFTDCYHLALTRHLGMSQIYTFDQKMSRFPGVERVEP
jgi:predicted nucleic acid-binding protein